MNENYASEFHENVQIINILTKLFSNKTSMNLCTQKRMNINVDVP